MNLTVNHFYNSIPDWVIIMSGFLSAFVITYLAIPSIVKISKHKKLFDVPNERTSHADEIPVLGGIGIFAGLTISIIICSLSVGSDTIKYILGGVIILFFVGLKDDILIIDPKKKLLGQIFASIVVILLGDVRIIDFHSLFGIDHLSYISSILFTMFLFLTLINGFNLIDGVDGLASGTGILTSLILGLWFMMTGHQLFSVIGVSLSGALLAYFRFNVFSKSNKIFMGDTGAMITGMIIAVLTVEFLEFNSNATNQYRFVSPPAIAFSLLILPLFDTIRVFILRIWSGRSPFKADKNHIHHLLLEYGFTHLQITFLLIVINVLFVILVFFFQSIGNVALIISILILASILTLVVKKKVKTQERNKT